ncbi:MAG: hypothetical protein V7722_09290, partial [Porticoccus sp.]
AVAHLVEPRIVTPEVAGSRPVGHPIFSLDLKRFSFFFNQSVWLWCGFFVPSRSRPVGGDKRPQQGRSGHLSPPY